jgi:hypothetical protein
MPPPFLPPILMPTTSDSSQPPSPTNRCQICCAFALIYMPPKYGRSIPRPVTLDPLPRLATLHPAALSHPPPSATDGYQKCLTAAVPYLTAWSPPPRTERVPRRRGLTCRGRKLVGCHTSSMTSRLARLGCCRWLREFRHLWSTVKCPRTPMTSTTTLMATHFSQRPSATPVRRCIQCVGAHDVTLPRSQAEACRSGGGPTRLPGGPRRLHHRRLRTRY